MLCNLCLYVSRSNISVAIVYMYPNDKPTQASLLGAFYWGYTFSQIPGGWLAARFGGKPVLCAAVVLWSAATFIAAPWGDNYAVLFASRVVVGLAEGWNYPCQIELCSRWIPHSERSRAWAFLSSGESIGTVAALLGAPFLEHAYGWPSIFYVSGGLGLVWLALFAAFAASTPREHRCISRAEVAYVSQVQVSSCGANHDMYTSLSSV